MKFYLGIDVGTGSARAGIFTAQGRMAGQGVVPIQMWRPSPDHVEQSSQDIWKACCQATRTALGQAGIDPAQVHGIGFDATCSLVALDAADNPVSVSISGNDEQNVVVWMDHRAVPQAERINAGGHDVLKYVGGVISPEMQTPKLLWLKENAPQCWSRTARFLDLPDFLTYRATGQDIRSLCTTVCKWTYLGHKGLAGEGWAVDYLESIGLGDLAEGQFARIGKVIRPMGEAIGRGLSASSARELGLVEGTPVGVSIIDAHAGGLGLLGARLEGEPVSTEALNRRLALIGGTSSCHMAVSKEARFISGIWGPYFSAMIPDLWLTEGGQSASGALIDHVINSHVAAAPLLASDGEQSIYELLNARLEALAQKAGLVPERAGELTRDLHVQPDFHGNRSPRADPTLRGALSGLALSATADDLALQYLATVQAVAYGTRHIIQEMNAQGYEIDTLLVCGGGTKNPVFLREHADATGCRLVLPEEPEAVLLGAAVLGAVAGGAYPGVLEAMNAMNRPGRVIEPSTLPAIQDFHARKYRVFQRLHDDFLAYREIMGWPTS